MRTLLSVALLAACGSSTPKQQPAPPAPAPSPEPHMEKAAAKMSLSQSGIVPDWIDKGADPCQDFFAYACGGFTKTATIPPDRSSWGAIQIVTKDNEEFLKKVLEDLSAKPGDRLGDFYAACMDEPGIEKAGITPI